MDKILKAAENFQSVNETEIDEKLFMEFMQKVATWDYFAIPRNHYLSLSESEKREKIQKYYVDMKSGNNVASNGKIFFFFLDVIKN